jgi:two-component system, sensor histidine kinase LadS
MKKIFLLLLISYSGFSQAKISYKKTDGLLDITPYISYMADSSEKLTFEQVRNLPESVFIANNKVGLNLGNGGAMNIWIKLEFSENHTNEDLYLYLDLLEANYITSYVLINNRISIDTAGVKMPFGSSYFKTNKNIFKIYNQPIQVYLKIESNGLYIPIFLSTVKPLVDYLYLYDAAHFFLIGLLLALSLYNLLLFFSLRDNTFIFYSGFTFMSACIILKVDGFQFVYLNFDYINDKNIFSSILILFVYLFATRFLNTKNLSPKFHKLLKFQLIIMMLFLPLEFLPLQVWHGEIHQLLLVIFMIFILICSIYVWKIGYLPAKYFVIAWSFYISGIVVVLLGGIGILPLHNFWVYYSWKIGHTFEALLMAFAVAYRFNLFRQEARDAQALVLQRSGENEQLLLAHNQILEEKLQLEEKISNQKPNLKVDDLLERLQSERGKNKKLAVSTIEGVLLLPIPDIIRLEALGSYCNIYLTNNKKIIASKNLAEFEPVLDKTDFLRIHKSHIININFVERYIRGEGGMVIMPDGAEVSVSRTMKTELLERLNIQ